jgi:anthranilate synthase component 1
VDRYSHVMRTTPGWWAPFAPTLTPHAYQACMNMGTLTGAPKLRASELIRMVEGKRRGLCGGAVGYLNGAGRWTPASSSAPPS